MEKPSLQVHCVQPDKIYMIHIVLYKYHFVLQVAEFFTGSGHHEKAVQLLVRTRHVEEALDLCSAHNILVTEEMADHMTPPKTPSGIYK